MMHSTFIVSKKRSISHNLTHFPKILYVLPLLLCTFLLQGQDSVDKISQYEKNMLEDEKCGIMYVQKMMEKTYGSDGEMLKENTDRANQAMRNRNTVRDVMTIPVVVHIIHNGEAVGTGANITEAQILSQIEVLNDDFRRMNADAVNTPADFQPVAADIELEFCLATVDPDGNPSNGIHRYNGGHPRYSIDMLQFEVKPRTIWNPEYYFNIWVAPLEGGLLGYAQFPDNSGLAGMPVIGGADFTDGIVVRDIAFGTTGSVFPGIDGGRTTTHEVGHFFGLRHIWGDGNSDNGCILDDFCDDTPVQIRNNGGLGSCVYPGPNTCDEGPGDLPDQFQNYMDYTPDVCMNLFTQDQKERVNVVIANSPRRNFENSQVCQGVAPPEYTAAFTIPPNDLCMDATLINCGQYNGTTFFASTSTLIGPEDCNPGEPLFPPFLNADAIASGVWYFFFAPEDNTITLSTCDNADYDTKIDVYTGSCDNLQCVAGNDDFAGCADFTSEITFNVTAGNYYYVYVSGFILKQGTFTGIAERGNFTLSMDCAIPIPIPTLTQWGLTILTLLFLILSIVGLKQMNAVSREKYQANLGQ